MKISNKSISIVTGATGGLGTAISNTILEVGGKLLFVARDYNKIAEYENTLVDEFRNNFFKFKADLTNKEDIKSLEIYLIDLLASRNDIQEIFLFNNASTIEPIELIENINFDQISNSLLVNVASAFALSAIVQRLNKNNKAYRINILNISSGVSLNPVKGWSTYCISKAGLNMLSKCIAIENDANQQEIFVLSINPGPINTEMQKIIRTADSESIPATKKFNVMFSEGKLQRPKDVAQKLFRILEKNEYSSGDFIDFNIIN